MLQAIQLVEKGHNRIYPINIYSRNGVTRLWPVKGFLVFPMLQYQLWGASERSHYNHIDQITDTASNKKGISLQIKMFRGA